MVGLALILGGAFTAPTVAQPSPPPGFKIVNRRALPPAPVVGHPLPAAQFERLTGGTGGSADWAGRPAVINFWATWSEASKGEAQLLQDAHAKWGKDVVVAGIEIGRSQRDAIQRFVAERGLAYGILVDPGGASAQSFRILALPTTFFVDREGTIRDIHIGALQAGDLEAGLQRILK